MHTGNRNSSFKRIKLTPDDFHRYLFQFHDHFLGMANDGLMAHDVPEKLKGRLLLKRTLPCKCAEGLNRRNNSNNSSSPT